MANENFINAEQTLNKLTQAFDRHEEAIKKSVQTLANLNREYNNLPSDYIRSQRELLSLQQQQARTEAELSRASQQAERLRQQEIQTQTRQSQLQRENIRLTQAEEQQRARLERQTRGLTSAFAQLNREKNESANRLRDLIVRGIEATQTQVQYDRELRNAQREFNALNERVTAANRAVGRFHDNVGNYPSQAIRGLRDLVSAFGLVGGVTAFAMVTKDIFNTARELQSLDLALNQVLGSTEAAAQAQQFLSRISEAYGIEIQGLTRSYTQFFAASQNAIDSGAITATQIQQIFESVSKASGAMGLSVDQQQGAFLALQQMISKGTVQAEEIRGQLAERLPGAFGILAKSMNVTEIQLNKLLKDGKVLAAEVLPAFARELEKAYGVENLERVESIAASTTRLSNAWTELVRNFSEGDGIISKSLSLLIDGLSSVLGGINQIIIAERGRDDQQKEMVRQIALRSELEIYDELKKEIGEIATIEKARDNAKFSEERISQLEAERRALEANIAATKEQRTQLYFKGGGVLNPLNVGRILKKDNTIRDQSEQLRENAYELGKFQGALEAANKVIGTNQKLISSNTGAAKRQKVDIDYLKEAYEIRKQNADFEIASQKRIMDDDERSYSIRLEAANNYYFQIEKLIELERDEQIRLNNLSAKNQSEQYKLAISKGEASAKNLVQIEYQRLLREQKINDKFLNERSNLEIEAAKKLKGVWDKINFQKETNLVSEATLKDTEEYLRLIKELVDGNEDYRKAEEAAIDFQKASRKSELENAKIAIDIIESEISQIKDKGDNIEKLGKLEESLSKARTNYATIEIKEYEEKEAALKKLQQSTESYLNGFSSDVLSQFGFNSVSKLLQVGESGKSVFQELMDGADGLGEKFAVVFNSVTEIAQEAYAFITQAQQAQFDAEYSGLEKRKEIALKFAGESAEAQAEIEQQYDEKRREIRLRELKAQKEAAIFNAIINTAQGITAALAKGSYVLAAVIAALGAAQIAFISSQSIPAYAEGGVTDSSGTILVNDAKGSNYKEVVQTPSGKVIKPNGRNRLMNVPKGTTIYKDYNTFDKKLNETLAESGIAPFADVLTRDNYGNVTNVVNQGITSTDLRSALKDTFSGISTVNQTVDKNGFGTYVSKGHTRMQEHKNRIQFNGMIIRK